MAVSDHIGARVRIKTEDGIYEGTIHQVNLSNSKLSLEKVVDVETGKRLQGLQNFYGKELESLDYIETGPPVKSSPAEDNRREKGQSLLSKGSKYNPPHLKRLREKDNCDSSSGDEQGAAQPNTPVSSKSDYDSGIDQEGCSKIKSRFAYTVVDKLDDTIFCKALSHISCQTVIGVALEGLNVGRNGELCWLQIDTGFHIFLFDVKTLGRDCFPKGLTEILQHEKILKVMHNCRLPSDMLWHQYRVHLVNIFDTQVADAFVYRNSRWGDWPRHVSGLPVVLLQYLDLTPADVHISKVHKRYTQEDEAFWAERPAPGSVLDAAVKEVAYLRELHMVLLERLLIEYTAGVDLYLSQVRCAPSAEARRLQETSHLLPKSFIDLPSRIKHSPFGNGYRKAALKTKEHDLNGFYENFRKLQDPTIFDDSKLNFTPARSSAKSAQLSEAGELRQNQGDIPDSTGALRTGEVVNDYREHDSAGHASPPTTHFGKPPVGRGSILSSTPVLPDTLPWAAQVQQGKPEQADSENVGPVEPDQFKSLEAAAENSTPSDADGGSTGPDWATLLPSLPGPKTDLTGLILKPGGISLQVKIQKKEISKGGSLNSSISLSQCGSKKELSACVMISDIPPLQEDCFDMIPPSKSRLKKIPMLDEQLVQPTELSEDVTGLADISSESVVMIRQSPTKTAPSICEETLPSRTVTPPLTQPTCVHAQNDRMDQVSSAVESYREPEESSQCSESSVQSSGATSASVDKPPGSLSKLSLLIQLLRARDQIS